MTDYAKITVSVAYSESSDYSAPYLISPDQHVASYASTECSGDMRIQVGTGGTDVHLGFLSSPAQVVVVNEGGSAVEATWTDTSSPANVNAQKIPNGGSILVIPDLDPAETFTLTAATAASYCRVKAFA
jgi:hypothetical protein